MDEIKKMLFEIDRLGLTECFKEFIEEQKKPAYLEGFKKGYKEGIKEGMEVISKKR